MATTTRTIPFRGWRILGWCTLTIVLTAPGQTLGVAVFIDRFIDDLGLGRSAVSSAYLIGTITGALALPVIGRAIDRHGVRASMTLIGLAFGTALVATGAVQGFVTLALAFVGIRMLGQGALSLVSQTGIALWFDRRRGLAIAISMTLSAGLMALAPVLLSVLIDAVGWRTAWVVAGVTIWLTVVPIARWALVDRPSDLGQLPDGAAPDDAEVATPPRSMTSAEALRTPAFWTVIAMTVLTSSLVTGLTFHHVSVMAAGGLTRTEAAAVFLPQVVGTIISGFVFGWLTDRVSVRVLLPLSGSTLVAGLLLATVVEPGAVAAVYGLVIGLNIGSIRAIGSAVYPKWFGTGHIGAIRGIATSFGVGASAIGPLLVSVGNDAFGSYSPVLVLSAGLTAVVATATALVVPPERARS